RSRAPGDVSVAGTEPAYLPTRLPLPEGRGPTRAGGARARRRGPLVRDCAGTADRGAAAVRAAPARGPGTPRSAPAHRNPSGLPSAAPRGRGRRRGRAPVAARWHLVLRRRAT